MKIIQIIPAERGWIVSCTGDIPSEDEIACWGLREDGVVVPMISGIHGNTVNQATVALEGRDFSIRSPVDQLKRIADSLAGSDEETDGNFYDQMERIKDVLGDIDASLASIDGELESIKNHIPD